MLQDDTALPVRRRNRWAQFDYRAPGAYFVTICTRLHVLFFGRIENDRFLPTAAGAMVADVWKGLPSRFPGLRLDAFVVMPNHVHGVCLLTRGANAALAPFDYVVTEHGVPLGNGDQLPDDASSLSKIVGCFKSWTTLRYICGVKECGWPRFDRRLWQRSFHDHIVRNENELADIRRYIAENPSRWRTDRYHS